MQLRSLRPADVIQSAVCRLRPRVHSSSITTVTAIFFAVTTAGKSSKQTLNDTAAIIGAQSPRVLQGLP